MSSENPSIDRIVIALGGNALIRAGETGTIEQQIEHAGQAMRAIAGIARSGATMILTHGNGPIVGNIVMRGEAARDIIPPMPLYIADADSGGGIGLMLMQALHNALVANGTRRRIAAGGGGVPVTEDGGGALCGVDAVVDKDWTGALLAIALRAEVYAILIEADALYDGFGTPSQQRVERLTPGQVATRIDAGGLDEGSIEPKVAAAYAVDTCGCSALLCSASGFSEALAGRGGTWIIPA